ncbi:hypothetical protein ACSTIX_24535, partial [Vibrio parahaemolyticus]
TGAPGPAVLDDDPLLKSSGVRVGKSGVEAGMEEELRGAHGRAQVEVDARGRFVRRLSETSPVAGQDVRLTVDTGLQVAVAERL